MSVRSKGRTDGKSVCRTRCIHTACNTHDRTCTDDNNNDTLGKGHRADVRRAEPHGAGSVEAGNARSSKRRESKAMNHLKSRTKPPDTRPNLNHWCEPMSRTENHVPLIIANNYRTRNPTPDPSRQCTTRHKSTICAGHKQTKKTQVQKSDTPPGKFEESSSSP